MSLWIGLWQQVLTMWPSNEDNDNCLVLILVTMSLWIGLWQHLDNDLLDRLWDSMSSMKKSHLCTSSFYSHYSVSMIHRHTVVSAVIIIMCHSDKCRSYDMISPSHIIIRKSNQVCFCFDYAMQLGDPSIYLFVFPSPFSHQICHLHSVARWQFGILNLVFWFSRTRIFNIQCSLSDEKMFLLAFLSTLGCMLQIQ